MNFKRVAVLTSKNSWFLPYAKDLSSILRKQGYSSELFYGHEQIGEEFEIVFILSYVRIIKSRFLNRHVHNLVVHESNLPKGRGWAPLFWQILAGKNRIPVVLFEAKAGVDKGDILIRDYIILGGSELHDEIREKQGKKTIDLCLRFLREYKKLKNIKQKGKVVYYRKRVPEDSHLDINKNIKDQFNLLRITNNGEFPAFFDYKKHRYILKIYKKDKQ